MVRVDTREIISTSFREITQFPLQKSIGALKFYGLLGEPGKTVGALRNLPKPPEAVLNAGETQIHDPTNPGHTAHIAVARVMLDEPQKGPDGRDLPDRTDALAVYHWEKTPKGLLWECTQVIDPNILKTPEQKDINIEDMRLTYLPERNCVVAAFTAAEPNGRFYMAYATAVPVSENGQINLNFSKMVIPKDKNGHELDGKNGIIMVGDEGQLTMMYRPEFLEDGSLNRNHFRFMSLDIDKPDEAVTRVDEDMIIPLIPGIERYGWNGGNTDNALVAPNGDLLYEFHELVKTTEGEQHIFTYNQLIGGFRRKVNGTLECRYVIETPFFPYEFVEPLVGKMKKLRSNKNVTYSNGGSPTAKLMTCEDAAIGYIECADHDIFAFIESARENGGIILAPLTHSGRRDRLRDEQAVA